MDSAPKKEKIQTEADTVTKNVVDQTTTEEVRNSKKNSVLNTKNSRMGDISRIVTTFKHNDSHMDSK